MAYNGNNNDSENISEITSDKNMKTEKTNLIEENDANFFSNNRYCKYCGTKIKPNLNFCKNCGRSTVDEQVTHCVKCGFVLAERTKYCPKCGKKIKYILPNNKKISNKKKKVISLSIIIMLILSIIGGCSYFVLPEVLASPYKIMEDGNYEKAYNKADYKEKKDVLYENLVAACCEKMIKLSKYPNSFELENVWLDEKNDKLVLQIGMTNDYSENKELYCLFEYNKNKYAYDYYNSINVGDFSKEECETYDKSSELAEKQINNFTKTKVKDIVENDSLKVENGMIERINNLNQQNLLEDIKLLSQVELLYPDD